MRFRMLCALLAGFPATVGAQTAPPPTETDPLLEKRNWLAGTIQEQLDRDGRLVPFGKGALFIPSMTHGLDEPPVTVSYGGKVVAESTSGTRIILEPGTYRVELGSGSVRQRMSIETTVREMHTTVVPTFWAGLSVHVVDRGFQSLRGGYELIRVDDREYMGIGFGTNEQAGEPVATWVIRPGLYKIVRVGENYRARTDFATVRLEEGHLTHFLLVLDPETGAFQGAGEVPVDELFRLGSGLGGNLLVGGDLTLSSRRNSPGTTEGETFSFNAFIDSRLNYSIDRHFMTARLQVEEGQTRQPGERFRPNRDRAVIDALYVFNWFQRVGPYVQLGAETKLFPEPLLFDEATVVSVDGVTRTNPTEELELRPSFGLSNIKEGAGVNVRVIKTIPVEISTRIGIGGRHDIARDLLEEINDLPDECIDRALAVDPVLDCRAFRTVSSNNQFGIEATVLAAARITRYVLLNIEADSLIPFDDPNRIRLDLEAQIALKLTRFLSINYTIRFIRNRAVLAADPLEQDLVLRFSWDVI